MGSAAPTSDLLASTAVRIFIEQRSGANGEPGRVAFSRSFFLQPSADVWRAFSASEQRGRRRECSIAMMTHLIPIEISAGVPARSLFIASILLLLLLLLLKSPLLLLLLLRVLNPNKRARQ